MRKLLTAIKKAIVLDHMGFVSELNDANLHMIRGGTVYIPTPHARLSRLPGYRDDVFATGTMGGITPTTEIDGRKNNQPVLASHWKILLSDFTH